MKRDAAMLTCYFAAMETGVISNYAEGFDLYQTLGDAAYDEMSWDYGDAFPSWHEPGIANENSWDDRLTAAYFFNLSYLSPLSHKRLIEYDEAANSLHLNQTITEEDGLRAIVRLMDGVAGSEMPLSSEARAEVAQSSALRREAILSSVSDYTATGRTYYVSESGDDANDGLSPETAWKTLDKVNSAAYTWDGQLNNPSFPEFLWVSTHMDEKADIQRGDCVLFERGGLWRGGLRTVEGVTYSAYGEGEKPRIYGSPENGAGAEKWLLVEGTENVWQFYQPLQDCGAIRCDDETVCLRDYAAWDGEQYRLVRSGGCYDGIAALKELPVLSPKTITDDLHFYCSIRYENGFDHGAYGTLYLRSDTGNPGERFSSLEFLTGNDSWHMVLAGVKNDVILDNLCFRYGAAGINAHDSHNAIIRNCEIGWVGGIVMSDNGMLDEMTAGYSDQPEQLNIMCTGDAIMLGGQGNQALNNYITNTFDFGITVEGFSANPEEAEEVARRRDCTVSGNLLEACNGGLLMVDWYAINHGLDAPTFVDICFDDNMVIDTGTNTWSHHDQRYDESGASLQTGMAALALIMNPGCENITVSNNLLAYSSEQNLIVSLGYYDEEVLSQLTLADNTYQQHPKADFLAINAYGAGRYTVFPYSDSTKNSLEQGDISAEITILTN